MENKWWLISEEDVEKIRALLRNGGDAKEILYVLDTGLNTTDEVPEDFADPLFSTFSTEEKKDD